MSADRLVEVPRADWPKLRDLYLPDKSKSYIAYTALESYISWCAVDPDIKHVMIYSLNGDFSDGTFAIIDRYFAYVDTFDESIDNLRRLLRLLDFSKGLWFLTERSKVSPLIYEIIEEKRDLVIPENGVIPLVLYRLAKEKALKFDINPKPGINVRRLDIETDLEKTSSVWPFKTPTTLPFFERMIQYSATAGAYDVDGKLLSWIFRYPTGPLASLYTDKDYLGQGLASLVTRQLCKTLAELGHDSMAGITATNTASLNLFKKIGFEFFDEMSWISTEISWSEADE